jgi:predicted RNA binding protein YcfA (HicA-like mRNA interferase family)
VVLVFISSRPIPTFKMERGRGSHRFHHPDPNLKTNVSCVRGDLVIICILRVI